MTDPVVVGPDKAPMGLLLLIIGLVVCLILLLSVAATLAAALRWLFWMIVRLGLAGLIVVAIALAGEMLEADATTIAPMATLAFVAALVATRNRGRTLKPAQGISAALSAPAKPASPAPLPLVSADLQIRLDTTECALAHAARDAHGVAADEWLIIWRRRVPDLIAAAQAHHDDLDPAGRAEVTAQLTERLDEVINEANRRIFIARKSRADLFNVRANHAEGRARNG